MNKQIIQWEGSRCLAMAALLQTSLEDYFISCDAASLPFKTNQNQNIWEDAVGLVTQQRQNKVFKSFLCFCRASLNQIMGNTADAKSAETNRSCLPAYVRLP